MLCNCYLPCRFRNPIRQSLRTYDDKQGCRLYSDRMFLASSLHLPSLWFNAVGGSNGLGGENYLKRGERCTQALLFKQGCQQRGWPWPWGILLLILAAVTLLVSSSTVFQSQTNAPYHRRFTNFQSTHSARVNFWSPFTQYTAIIPLFKLMSLRCVRSPRTKW